MLNVLALLGAMALGQATGSFSDGPISMRDGPVNVAVAGSAFTNLALNSSKTIDAIKVKGFRFVTFTLAYTYNAASAVTMSCQQSEDGTLWADLHVLQYTSFPTATSSPQTWSYAAGASKVWPWTVNVRTVYLRCTFGATGATASDTLSVTARAGF